MRIENPLSDYLSVEQTAALWGVIPRVVRYYIGLGRVPGAIKIGNSETSPWYIPVGTPKPKDNRVGKQPRRHKNI